MLRCPKAGLLVAIMHDMSFLGKLVLNSWLRLWRLFQNDAVFWLNVYKNQRHELNCKFLQASLTLRCAQLVSNRKSGSFSNVLFLRFVSLSCYFGESAVGEGSRCPSKPLTSLWILCSSLTESLMEDLGDVLARPVRDSLWLMSGAGLDSLLPDLEQSEADRRPAESRLAPPEGWGKETGSW